MKELPTWQLGWIAGIIDGEGSIGLLLRSDSRRENSLIIDSHIQVNMTHELTIKTLHSLTEVGHVYVRKGQQANHKTSYLWHVYQLEENLQFLRKIAPYLLTKREQAYIVIKFCEMKIAKVYDMDVFKEMNSKMKELNKKGR